MVVLDACGVGELPDAAAYGDAGANTLGHLAQAVQGLELPTLQKLGLGSILPLQGVDPAEDPVLHGRLHALGVGKDSTAGHWELMGVVSDRPMPTYPDGFPPAVVELIREISGREVICNAPSNGIEAIQRYGKEHLKTGALIVYTSQDSVLQVATHVEVLSTEETYAVCAELRGRLPERHRVGRVIARPFAGRTGEFERTTGRRDFSLPPPSRSYLQEAQDAGAQVHTVGKVGQLFSGIGVDYQHPGATNDAALGQTSELLAKLDSGLVFTNLIETDQVYGHRHDVDGFHRALREIDARVARWLDGLGEEDLLILTADHGCDPAAQHTDHTREHVPVLARFGGHGSRRHDGPLADVGASVLDWLSGRTAPELPGTSFI
ncbi:MAG: phosphopentomutase [Solirubrobacterales bacterium]|nr:phosphopentomutase [Solirubrobacterales bacterium]